MEEIEWILCPVCKSKTRLKIRKDTLFKIIDLFSLNGVFKFSGLSIEGSFRHSTGFSSLPECYFFISPCLMHLMEVFRNRSRRPAELHALGLSCCNPFLLAFFDVLTF